MPEAEPTARARGDGAPDVTVVCVPRDHYHHAAQSLDALLTDTEPPFELVYVLGRAPADIATHVRREVARAGFTLIERDAHLVPNHARNLALAHVRTRYVAFVDNDTVVTPGWLSALVACAEETAAALVGPLQLMGPVEDRDIHLAGGLIDIDGSITPHPIRITHRFQGRHVADAPEPLERQRCDFAEFHCMLARTEVLRAVGPLDEGFRSAREVEDLALKVRAMGATCWFEPSAVATFLPPSRLRWSEIGFLSHRWSEQANRQSHELFVGRYGLDRSHMSALGFINGLRRAMFWPVREGLSRLGAPVLARKVEYALHRLERPVNRLLVRPGRGMG